jgi:hypothetical protein
MAHSSGAPLFFLISQIRGKSSPVSSSFTTGHRGSQEIPGASEELVLDLQDVLRVSQLLELTSKGKIPPGQFFEFGVGGLKVLFFFELAPGGEEIF